MCVFLYPVLIGDPPNARGRTLPAGYRHPETALLRSLVVPGWGQFYVGARRWGTTFLVSDLSLVVGAVSLNQAALRIRRTSGDSPTVRGMLGASAVVAVFAVGVYAWNVLDIAIRTPLHNRRFSFAPVPMERGRGWMLVASLPPRR